MTAIHLLKTHNAAIIASDSAHFNDDGRIMYFGPKYGTIEAVRLAFGMSGRGNINRLIEEMDKTWPGEGTQDEVLATMRTAAVSLRSRWRTEHPGREFPIEAAGSGNDFQIYVAMVSDDGPRLLALSTFPRPDIGGQGETFDWFEIEGFVQPAVDMKRLLPAGYWRGIRDCRPIFEAQRAANFELLGGSIGVGGDCYVTVITRDSVKLKRVCGWPDSIGDFIQRVSRPGRPAA